MVSPTRPLAALHGVDFAFPTHPPVLTGLTLSVAPGECVALVGPSGCGKSTVLRLVAGLLPPTHGTVSKDEDVETAFVFQEATLLPWLNVRDNVAVPLALRGIPVRERRQRAEEALARVGLAARADFFPRQLSGGQKMRASLARALAVRPKLLLLDEPFGALDEITRDSLNELVADLRAQDNWAVIVVTHSVREAVLVSDRVLVMQPGPGRIAREFAVPLGATRTAATRHGDTFHHLVDEISDALRAVTPALA